MSCSLHAAVRAAASSLLLAVVATRAAGAQANWPSYNGDLAGTRFSPLAMITRENVASLRPVCTFDTHEHIGFQTGPVVIDGAMYLTTDTATYAIDAATCQLTWHNSHVY